MIKITLNDEKLNRRWAIMVDASTDFGPALKQFSKHLRERTKGRFQQEGPGWPKLAPSTQEKLEHSFVGRINVKTGGLKAAAERKLAFDIAKKIKKGKLRGYASRQLKLALTGKASNDRIVKGLAKVLYGKKSSDKGLEKVSKEVAKFKGLSIADRKKKLDKKRKSAKHKLLGKLASSIRASIRKNTLEVYSRVEWAGIHNKGGTAAHGANIPKRTFLELDDEDVKVLAELLKGQLVEAFDSVE